MGATHITESSVCMDRQGNSLEIASFSVVFIWKFEVPS